MKHPLIPTICLAVLLFCIGCNSSAPTAPVSGLETRSLSELVDLAMSESENLRFCLSEGEGMESFQESAEQLQKIAQALPGSVAASGLSTSQTDKLNKSIGVLAEACDSLASSVENQASSAEIAKANTKVLRELKTLTKLSR